MIYESYHCGNWISQLINSNDYYRVFSRDVTAGMLVSLNNGTVAMLVYLTNPPRIEFFYHANVFFCFGGKTRLLTHE